MAPVDPRAVLADVATRVAGQVAAYGDRVAVDRAPHGAWDLDVGPYAVVQQTGPALPDLTGDGATLTDAMRVAVQVWQGPDDTSTVVPDTVAALESWNPYGLRPRAVGVYRVPQPDTDVLRTEVEVRYAHRR